MTEPTRTPLDPGFVQRVAQGFKYAVSGVTPSGWFSPSQPMQPVAQEEAKGRAWDYQSGYNLQIQPRANEPVGFGQLRGLADGYDLLRLVIETRKDQLERLKWTVQFRDPKRVDDGEDARVKEVKAKLLRPDGRLSWRQWMRVVLEDMLVIDAPSVYVRKTNGGKMFALEPIDGATIAPKVDDSGRIPFDGVAYQQIIKGVPACDYTATELIYYPRNLRSFRVYGFSPVEQIITTVNIALRRQIAQLQYFTDGNLPETLISVPKEWSVDQIKQFDEHFNSLMQGAAYKRRGYFVPDGTKPYQIKESPLKDEFDDWLARVVCFAFSVSPQGIVQMQNRATAQVGASESAKDGLEPLKLWMADFVNECIIKGWGYDDLEFAWVEEEAVDPLVQAQVNQIYINSRVLTPNEVRADLGRDPIEGADEMAQGNATPGNDNTKDTETEVGKSANAPFGLRKFLPDTEQVDADGAEEPSPERALLTDEDRHKAELAAAILLLLSQWRVTVWREIGWIIPENVSSDDLAAWAAKYASRTMDFVNATTAGKIRQAIEEARAKSTAQGDIAAKVRDIFNQARDERTGRIADTTSTGAFGFAALNAMAKAGVAESAWITERDGRVRPTHEAMDGQRRPIGMPFTSPSGAMALHPGGFDVAFENVSCRCHLRPVKMAKADSDSSDDDFWNDREAERAKGAKTLAEAMRKIFKEQEAAVMAGIKKD